MNWEFDWLDFMQTIHSPILNVIMVGLSTIGNAGIFWIVVTLIMVMFKKTRKCGFQIAFAMLITYIIGNLILKNAIQRDRPCWINPDVKLLVANPKDYSFPSGHTMNGIVASITIFLNNKKIGIPAIVLALLIAFSRLYNYVHFPTDVFGGIVIGVFCAIIAEWIFKKKGWKAPFTL